MTFGALCSTRVSTRRHHDWGMIACADVRQYRTARGLRGDCGRGEEVVEAPADVTGAQIPPRRPPREEIGVLGIELAAQIHELRAEESLEQRALLGSLAHGVRLALFGMHVDVRARDVHVAAENQVSPLRRQPCRPITETCDEGKLGGVVLAAVRDVD